MIYAPLLITTCNRIEHFTKCIESLKKNRYAQYTDLLVSLDYPPEDKYIEGNDAIRRVLKRGIEGFKKTHIFYQDKNFGAYENERFLITEAYKNFDRYIFTEDDNIFATNFLEFINKGLEIFENNNEIIAICATKASAGNMENDIGNITKSKNFCGYGFGTWKKKEDEYMNIICKDYYKRISKKGRDIYQIYKEHPNIYLSYMATLFKKDPVYRDKNDEIVCIDQAIKIYMILEKKYVIHPIDIISVNTGEDGSGLNSSNLHKGLNADMLTKANTFDYKIEDEINERTYSKKDRRKKFVLRSLYELILLLFYRVLGEKTFFILYNALRKAIIVSKVGKNKINSTIIQ